MGNHIIRMGKQMPFISPDGASHPNSFWCLDRLTVGVGDSSIGLRFIGYRSAADYNADRHPIAGAVREYLISGGRYYEAIQRATQFPTGTPISHEVLQMAWDIALEVKDQGLPPANPEDPDTRTSFFGSAAAVV